MSGQRKSLGGISSPFKSKTDKSKMVDITGMITNVIKMSAENVCTSCVAFDHV